MLKEDCVMADDQKLGGSNFLFEDANSEIELENPFTDTFGGMCYHDPETGELGNTIYFTGIIDLLQQYNRRKKFETFIKSRMDDVNNISSVNPEFYSRRFNRFLEQKIN